MDTIFKDMADKKAMRDIHSQMIRKTEDYSDNHVLSYVYSTKVSKAFDYDKKKEHLIGLMQKNYHASLPVSRSN